MQPMRHNSLSLQVPAAAADALHAIWRSVRGAVVILLRGGLPLRCEERLGIGDRWPIDCGRSRSGICMRRALQRIARPPLSTYDPPFAASMGLQTAFASPDETFSPLCDTLFHTPLKLASISSPWSLHRISSRARDSQTLLSVNALI